ncbi:DUF6807 family protein [Tautonia sp. JC769]|uniref:DUF6807 family protein n=1 Tax=Tautonia sp. JC769 TaxID=3232135 RepID=UPI003457E78A
MRHRLNVPLFALAMSLLIARPSGAQSIAIEVDAGAHARIQTPVSTLISLPETFTDGDVVILKSIDGQTLLGQLTAPSLLSDPAERDEGVVRELHFILPELAKGETARFDVSDSGADLSTIPSFAWEHSEDGDRLVRGDESILFYVRPELDESSPEARELTFKPFHHLFAPDGRRVTKGPGGLFTHHRGLFFGFNRVSYGDGKQADVWHARGKAYQSHEETLSEEAGPVLGRHRVRVGWHGQEGEIFALETREVTAYAAEEGYFIDFAALVETEAGPVMLDGDPQHAGVHFRADNHVADVSKGETYYLRTDGRGAPGETRNWEPKTGEGPVNLPWNAMSFVIDGDRYTVAYLDHPENPKEARYSERDYGRFGSYFEYPLTEDQPLKVRYRLWLQAGELSLERASGLDADFDDPVRVRVVQE